MVDIKKDDIQFGTDDSTGDKYDDGREELGLDDLSGNFVKNPQVGKSVDFIIKKMYRLTKNLEATDPMTKQKFSTALTGVEYGVEIETSEGAKFGVRNWETWGKVKAICKALGKTDGVRLRVTHLVDGMKRENKNKDIDKYEVAAFIGGNWKVLSKAGAWSESLVQ